jgi:predicted nuclease of predicted toxin-antitoxin system
VRAKLDENLEVRAIELLREGGHDVETVVGEDLGGASDEELIVVCGAEGWVLITLDLDFANVLRFPPSRHAGIAVLRLPHPVELGAIHERIRVLLEAVEREGEPTKRLWIVEQDRIREYAPDQ